MIASLPGSKWLLALAWLGLASSSAVGQAGDCFEVARQIARTVAAQPERVLLAVEDAVVANEGCACEIVKAAIQAAQASVKLTGQIVFTAVTASPKEAAAVADCATAVHPEAAEEVKRALRKAIGSESVVASTLPSGKQPAGKNPSGKQPIEIPVSEEVDFSLSPVAIGGVYLVYPSVGGGIYEKRIVKHVVKKKKVVKIECVTKPCSDDTPDIPDTPEDTPDTPDIPENTPEDTPEDTP